ncbi:hypothetical protein Tco_0546266 [Tanacetum coccineum]
MAPLSTNRQCSASRELFVGRSLNTSTHALQVIQGGNFWSAVAVQEHLRVPTLFENRIVYNVGVNCHLGKLLLDDIETKVRIYQKSHENNQKRASTDTGIRRVQKEAKESKPKPKNLSLSQKQSKDGQTKSTQKDKSSKYFTLVPQLSQKSKNVPSSLIGPRKAYWA